MLESEPESPVEKNFPQPKIASKRSDLGSYLNSCNCPALLSGLCESEAGDQIGGAGHQGLDEVPALFSGG
jgi:hypothetical protein